MKFFNPSFSAFAFYAFALLAPNAQVSAQSDFPPCIQECLGSVMEKTCGSYDAFKCFCNKPFHGNPQKLLSTPDCAQALKQCSNAEKEQTAREILKICTSGNYPSGGQQYDPHGSGSSKGSSTGGGNGGGSGAAASVTSNELTYSLLAALGLAVYGLA